MAAGTLWEGMGPGFYSKPIGWVNTQILGGAAGNLTVTGIKTGDKLVKVTQLPELMCVLVSGAGIGAHTVSGIKTTSSLKHVYRLGAGQPRRSVVSIPFASVRTLFATPYTIIAAPGAGKYIQVDRCHWWLDFGTAAYDAAAAGDTLELKYTNAAGAAVVDAIAGNAIGAAAADYHTLALAVPEVIPVNNAVIVAHINAGEWFAAAGDSPVLCDVLYRVRDFEPAVVDDSTDFVADFTITANNVCTNATLDTTAEDLLFVFETIAEDRSSEFSITATNTINNAAGSSTAGKRVSVEWIDAT
jgi:hypothetical protein